MKDIVNNLTQKFQKEHRDWRRYVAMLLVLALITTLFVNWQLHGVGISMTAEYQCGMEEHEHTADCYEKVLVCGYEEGEPIASDTVAQPEDADFDSGFAVEPTQLDEPVEPEVQLVPHVHTDACYEERQVLSCHEEEHEHTDDCFDPEDGTLICDIIPHTHDESCYTTEYELVCGKEEGELEEVENDQPATYEQPKTQPVVVTEPTPAADNEPVEVHHHTDDCYVEVLTCTIPEHHHTVECLSDPLEDVETEDDWLAKTDTTLSGDWAADLLTVAKSQVGYAESTKNFTLDGDDETVRGYSRYGEWYGNPYGEWDVMFLSYCLHYANVPEDVVPQEAGVLALSSDLRSSEWFLDVDGSVTMPGDIVIYNSTTDETVVAQPEGTVDPGTGLATYAAEPQTETRTVSVETVGIVSDVDDDAMGLTVISGDVDGEVKEVHINSSDVTKVFMLNNAYHEQKDESDPDDDIMILPTDTYIDYFDETKQDGSQGGITGVTITVNDKVQTGTIELEDGDEIILDYDYKIPAGTFTEDGENRTLTYHLPDGITLSRAIENEIDHNNIKVGTMRVEKDGTVKLTFNDKFDAHQPFSGSFGLKAKVNREDAGDSGTIVFPGDEATIVVKEPQDIGIKKSGTWDESTGKTIIHYTVEVSSKDGWNENIFIEDLLDNSQNMKGKYLWDSFKLVKEDKKGNEESVTIGSKLTKTNEDAGFKIEGLDELGKKEKYILTYDVEITENTNPNGSGSFGNAAKTNNNQSTKPYLWHGNYISKGGSYNADDGYMYWTVTVENNNGGGVKGYKVTDILQDSGAEIVGDVTVTEKGYADNGWQDRVYATITDADGKTQFEYTFGNDAVGPRYEITYKTKVPEGAAAVKNNASVEPGNGGKYDASGNAAVTDRKWNVKKSATESDLVATDDANIYKAYWKISTPVPNNWADYQIKDNIYKSNEGKHYGIAKELQEQFERNLEFKCTDGTSLSYAEAVAAGIGIEIHYYDAQIDKSWKNEISADDDTTPVQSFEIKLTNNYTGSKRIKELSIDNYYSYVDVDDIPNDTKVSFRNKANNSEAKYYYEKKTPVVPDALKKGVSSSDYGSQISQGNEKDKYTSKVTVSYNNDGKTYLYYQILVDLSELKDGDPLTENRFKEDEVTITDSLPKGLKFVEGSEKATLWRADNSFWHETYRDWNYTNIDGQHAYNVQSNPNKMFFEATTDGQNVNFTFKKLKTLGPATVNGMKLNGAGDVIKGFMIRYTVEVDTDSSDSVWKDPETDTWLYTNTVSWNGHSSSADATVNRKVTVLDKEAKQMTRADGSKTNGATYTLTINPTGKDLVPGKDYLTLTDTLTVQKGFTAQLLMDSVNLYDASNLNDPLPDTLYSFSIDSSVNADGENVYTLTFSIPDQRALVLKYNYTTNAKGQTVTLKNKATLEGGYEADSSKKLDKVSSWADVKQGLLTVHKVDSTNQKIGLAGAVFRLYKFDVKTGEWDTIGNQTTKTNAAGVVSIYVGDNNFIEMETDTLYKLVEDSAPTGYTKSDNEYYFVWTSDAEQSEEDAYRAAVNNHSGDDIPKFSETKIYRYGVGYDLYVPNERSELTIQKFWTDKNNNAIKGSDAPEMEITVNLYRYAKGQSKDTAQWVETIKLTKNDNWTYVYTDLEQGYYYFIQEASTDGKYKVIESTSNQTGVENGGVISITNRQKDSDGYELPSTGGMGTAPFGLLGSMMAASAALLLEHKRKKQGKAQKTESEE